MLVEDGTPRKKRDWYGLACASIWCGLLGSLGVGFASILGYPLYKVTTADGKSDYCFVETQLYTEKNQRNGDVTKQWTTGYTLKQHVPWERDRVLVTEVQTSEEIRKEAEKFGCQIR